MPIARAGGPVILVLLLLHLIFLTAAWLVGGWPAAGLLSSILMVLSVLFALLTLFSIFFFRDPERNVPQGGGLVVSPADGRVLGVEEIEETEYIAGPASRASIFMNLFDVHVNRFPVSGVVRYKSYRPGKFFNASLDKASLDNESLALGIESADSVKVLVRQIAGLVARRIICSVEQGQSLKQGQRFGMICFGSRLEVYLPPAARWQVAAGDRVVAGESILATLP